MSVSYSPMKFSFPIQPLCLDKEFSQCTSPFSSPVHTPSSSPLSSPPRIERLMLFDTPHTPKSLLRRSTISENQPTIPPPYQSDRQFHCQTVTGTSAHKSRSIHLLHYIYTLIHTVHDLYACIHVHVYMCMYISVVCMIIMTTFGYSYTMLSLSQFLY